MTNAIFQSSFVLEKRKALVSQIYGTLADVEAKLAIRVPADITVTLVEPCR